MDYPAVRQFTADIGRLSKEKHTIQALLEADVTEALEKIKILRKSGIKISFLAWFCKILADTVSENPPVNGIRKGKNSVIVFKQIDIATIIERKVEDKPVPLPVVLRNVNNKPMEQISDEIQAAAVQNIDHEGNLVLGSGENSLMMKLALLAPQKLRCTILRQFVLKQPERMQKMMGTVMVSSLGTTGRVSSFILPTSIHPLSLGIGTINRKPAFFRGSIQPRQILHLTISFDHDVIDGMPARRFVDDLVTRITEAEGLDIESSKQV